MMQVEYSIPRMHGTIVALERGMPNFAGRTVTPRCNDGGGPPEVGCFRKKKVNKEDAEVERG